MQSLSEDELQRILGVAKQSDPQDHLIMLLAFETFGRVSEVLALRRGDVLPDGRIVLHRLKGSKTNCLPMSAEARSILEAVLPHRPNASDLLFNRPRRTLDFRMKRYAEKAGVGAEKAHMHSLKHTACQHALDSTGNLLAVQQLAGHSDIGSTLQYAKLSVEQALQIRHGKAYAAGGVQ